MQLAELLIQRAFAFLVLARRPWLRDPTFASRAFQLIWLWLLLALSAEPPFFGFAQEQLWLLMPAQIGLGLPKAGTQGLPPLLEDEARHRSAPHRSRQRTSFFWRTQLRKEPIKLMSWFSFYNYNNVPLIIIYFEMKGVLGFWGFGVLGLAFRV